MEIIKDDKSHFDINKIIVLIVVLFAIAFLSMPARADLLSYHGSGSLFVVDIGNPNNCGEDTAFAYSQTDNSIVETTNPKVTTSAGITVQGVCAAPPTSVNSHIDLGASLRVTGISTYVTANTGRTVVFWGSNTTGSNYQNLGSIVTNVAGGWKNFTVTDATHYRYIGMSDAGAGVNGVNERISELVVLGNALPNITAWSNSFTGNSSLNIAPPTTTTVIFSATAVDQPVQYYNWTVDGVDQNNNFSSIARSFSIAAHTVSVTATNTNGTSIPVTWNINGASPPAPSIPSGQQGAIAFDADNYLVNQVGYLTTNMTFGLFDISSYRIDFYSTKNPLIQQFPMDKSQTTQTFLVTFPEAAVYTANIVKSTPLFGDSIIATDTAQAIDPISYILAPATAVTGSNITINYQFGAAPSSAAIEDVTTDEFGLGGTGIFINTTICPCDNQIHHINYTINGVGKHTLRLWDTASIKVLASTITQVTDTGAIVPGNITSNQLFLDDVNYSVNDVINGQYQISSFNWTNYGYFKASLVSSGNISMGSVTLNSQVGKFQLPVSGGAFNIFQSGAANVTIFAGTSVLSAINVMVSVPVTILSDKNGYSISVNPVNICRTQTEYVKYTSPSGAGILQVMSMTPAGTTKFTNISFSQNGTQKFVFNDGTVRDKSGIIFNILDINGVFQVNDIVKYQSTGCTAPGTTPTETATPSAGVGGGGGDVVNLLSSNIFWALIMISGLMMYIAKETMGQKK